MSPFMEKMLLLLGMLCCIQGKLSPKVYAMQNNSQPHIHTCAHTHTHSDALSGP